MKQEIQSEEKIVTILTTLFTEVLFVFLDNIIRYPKGKPQCPDHDADKTYSLSDGHVKYSDGTNLGHLKHER